MELADVADSKSAGSDTVPVRLRPAAPRRSKVRFAPFFYAEKHPPAPLLLLFRKKSRLFRLCPCKRGHNGAAALSTFFGYAPSAYRYHFWKVNPRHHPVPSSTKKYDHVPCIAVGRRYNLIGCFTDDAPIHDGIPCHIV